MFQHIRERVHELRQLPPGERFQQYFRQRERKRLGRVVRLLVAVIGLVAGLLGFIMLFTPGPGIVFLLFGGAILAEESLWVARAMDWSELRMRAFLSAVRRLFKKDRAVS